MTFRRYTQPLLPSTPSLPFHFPYPSLPYSSSTPITPLYRSRPTTGAPASTPPYNDRRLATIAALQQPLPCNDHRPATTDALQPSPPQLTPIALDIATAAAGPLLFLVPVLAQSIHDHHRRLTGLGVLLWSPVLACPLTPHLVHTDLGWACFYPAMPPLPPPPPPLPTALDLATVAAGLSLFRFQFWLCQSMAAIPDSLVLACSSGLRSWLVNTPLTWSITDLGCSCSNPAMRTSQPPHGHPCNNSLALASSRLLSS